LLAALALALALGLLAFAGTATGVEAPAPQQPEAVATTTPPQLEDLIRATFPEEPETMARVARCESSGDPNVPARQFETDGVTPRYGRLSDDLGAFQVNHIHYARAAALGYDLSTEAGNVGFARVLYLERGTKPWVYSSHCWG